MTLLDLKDPLAEAAKRGDIVLLPHLSAPIPAIDEVDTVGEVHHVPFGDEEGRPYFSVALKSGGRPVNVYGRFMQTRKLHELKRAIEICLVS